MGTHRLGVDTGGTYTDVVAISDDGRLLYAKVDSTPARPAYAVLQGITRVDLPSEGASHCVVATTIATNAVLSRAGSRAALVTTAGFEDVLEIQRIDRPPTYDLQWKKTKPFVPRMRVLGVAERIDSKGRVRTPLAEEELRRVSDAVGELIRTESIDSVAISLLFSYVCAAHEEILKARILHDHPGLCVSASSEVAPVWREYERASTTVIDAYVAPTVHQFVDDLEVELSMAPSVRTARASLLKSNAGHVPLRRAAATPAQYVLSGLAGGLVAGAYWARKLGSSSAVTLDMGGTSADIGLVADGQLRYTGSYEPEWGLPVCIPTVDVTTIGAGGSSIARLDGTGILRVGPESAGADPGPVAYGRGGTQPTVTDANLVLGRLAPSERLSSSFGLDLALANEAYARLATSLGSSAEDAARDVIAVAVHNMANSIRLIAADRGEDYRQCDLIAFGGAGPLHAVELAAVLGMRRTIVPPEPGITSALGTLIADFRVDKRTTFIRILDRDGAEAARQRLGALAQDAITELRDHVALGGAEDMQLNVATFVACRYQGQNYEHEVRTTSGYLARGADLEVVASPDSSRFAADVASSFANLHERKYGYALENEPVECVHLAAVAWLEKDPVSFVPFRPDRDSISPDSTRHILDLTGPWTEAEVRMRATLVPGETITGPAIALEPTSSTLIPSGFTATVDPSYCLIIEPSA